MYYVCLICGNTKKLSDAIAEAVGKRKAKILGEFGCFGFNTFGPFKLIGGREIYFSLPCL